MKNIRWTFAALLFLSYGTLALAQTPDAGQRLTSSKVIDYFVTLEETRLVAVADAMPQDKYPFSPTSGEFKGVRTFAPHTDAQATHPRRSHSLLPVS
jgi:hypothetical protein